MKVRRDDSTRILGAAAARSNGIASRFRLHDGPRVCVAETRATGD